MARVTVGEGLKCFTDIPDTEPWIVTSPSRVKLPCAFQKDFPF